jgi:hypothetical protein
MRVDIGVIKLIIQIKQLFEINNEGFFCVDRTPLQVTWYLPSIASPLLVFTNNPDARSYLDVTRFTA